MTTPPHVIRCRGCGNSWTEGVSEGDECACTCTDTAAPHYEDWLTRVFDHAERDLASLPEWARPVVVPPLTRGEPVPAVVPDSTEGKAGDGIREDGAAGDHPS